MTGPLVLALMLGAVEPDPTPETRTYAIIVATNEAQGEVLSPLRYADDDGARYFELLEMLGGPVELLSVLDRETQTLHPEIAARARTPVARELHGALDRTFRAIDADNARGVRTVFYFVYVGHGSISSSGEGQVHLLDRRFSRSDLYQKVIDRSPARVNHIVIDACNAYFMVARRGSGDQEGDKQAIDRFLSREQLAEHPNTGVIVSTSQAQETHEWSRFMSGIFSHEVRSAMAGAADVDGDGLVRYDELDAFLDAANARVIHPSARLNAYVAPPRLNLAEPVFDSRLAEQATRLELDERVSGRMHIEDERGVRVADFNTAPDGPITLVLNPGSRYFLRGANGERTFKATARHRVHAARVQPQPRQIAARGSEDQTFRRDLFAVPFGRAYFHGFSNARARDVTPNPVVVHAPADGWTGHEIAAASLGGGAAIAAAAGIVLGVLASDRAEAYRNDTAPQAEIDHLRSDSRTFSTAANALYVTSAGLAATALVLWLID